MPVSPAGLGLGTEQGLGARSSHAWKESVSGFESESRRPGQRLLNEALVLGVEVIVTCSCLCNPVGGDLPSRSDAVDTKTGLRSQGAF